MTAIASGTASFIARVFFMSSLPAMDRSVAH